MPLNEAGMRAVGLEPTSTRLRDGPRSMLRLPAWTRVPESNRAVWLCRPAPSRLAESGGIEPLAFWTTPIFRTGCRPFSGALQNWSQAAELNRAAEDTNPR